MPYEGNLHDRTQKSQKRHVPHRAEVQLFVEPELLRAVARPLRSNLMLLGAKGIATSNKKLRTGLLA